MYLVIFVLLLLQNSLVVFMWVVEVNNRSEILFQCLHWYMYVSLVTLQIGDVACALVTEITPYSV